MQEFKIRGYTKYLKGRTWFCKKSPVKAHWWVEHRRIRGDIFICKYCLKETTFQGGR
jgi:hypothetical protein